MGGERGDGYDGVLLFALCVLSMQVVWGVTWQVASGEVDLGGQSHEVMMFWL